MVIRKFEEEFWVGKFELVLELFLYEFVCYYGDDMMIGVLYI